MCFWVHVDPKLSGRCKVKYWARSRVVSRNDYFINTKIATDGFKFEWLIVVKPTGEHCPLNLWPSPGVLYRLTTSWRQSDSSQIHSCVWNTVCIIVGPAQLHQDWELQLDAIEEMFKPRFWIYFSHLNYQLWEKKVPKIQEQQQNNIWWF